ncbi:uncharacterized protein LOC109800502 [Cajanus cajan]|uniref:uncharacterized protein LOC109800502 n=1 Tax=Cajanus cajan TaxID=3821 RepID=UPI0010FB1D25|nr:uncharacterized protein LOC109800502 [Cajanus cajan]
MWFATSFPHLTPPPPDDFSDWALLHASTHSIANKPALLHPNSPSPPYAFVGFGTSLALLLTIFIASKKVVEKLDRVAISVLVDSTQEALSVLKTLKGFKLRTASRIAASILRLRPCPQRHRTVIAVRP